MVTQDHKVVHISNDSDEYEIHYSIKWDHYQYGADADGNRSERRSEILDVEVIDSYKNGHIILTKDIPIDVLSQANKEAWE